MVVREQFSKARQVAEDFVVGTMNKYSFGTFGRTGYQRADEYKPPYERSVSFSKLKGLAETQSLVNNSIEEKVQQAFRRGFDNWEKKYEAKCPECKTHFHSAKRFARQLGMADDEFGMDEIDFSQERVCPECGEKVDFVVPSEEMKEYAQSFFERANERDSSEDLVSESHSSVSQTFLQVCREVGWDIQMYDDGWMIFEKRYSLDEEGSVEEWMPEAVFRAPPARMRYSVDDGGKFGNEFWVCLACRASNPEEYHAQEHPGPCDECENRTYECFAYLLDNPQGEPQSFFVRGEFAHDSEYRPSRLYGLSAIISVMDEAQTLQQMDDWYRMAYENRRAPRGAIVLDSQNNDSVRSWTKEQTQKLNNDPNHIPVFMGDGEGSSRPIEWISLLDEPAQMQHMQMREWFLDRIAAKFGVTQVFESASAQSTGMSQSMEIVVSNRSAQRLQRVFEDTFLPAFISFLRTDGWERHLNSPEEEDESAVEQMMGRRLQNVQTAYELGFEVEWTENDTYDIKPARLEQSEEEQEEDGGGMGSMFGPDPTAVEEAGSDDSQSNESEERVTTDEGVDSAGTTSTSGGRPEDANLTGGGPDEPDTPTTDDPLRRSGDTVTVDTGGYRNVTYGGKPAEVINVLRDVEEDDDEEKKSRVDELRQRYNECVDEVGDKMPAYEDIERSVLQRPDKGYEAFRRSKNGPWKTNYQAEQFVKTMYEFIEENINE